MASWTSLAQAKVVIEVSAFAVACIFMRSFGFIDRHGKYYLLVPSSKEQEKVLLILLDSIIPLFHAYSFFHDKISGIYKDDPKAESEVIGEEISSSRKDNSDATDSMSTQQAQNILLDIQQIMTLQVSIDFISTLRDLTMSVLKKVEGRKIYYSLLQTYFP